RQRVGVIEAAVAAGGGDAERARRGAEAVEHGARVDLERPLGLGAARVLAEAGGPAAVLPEARLVARVPVARALRPEVGREEQDPRGADAARGLHLPAARQLDAEGHEAERVGTLALEGPQRA